MARETGFPRADAEHDFLRARRRQVLSRLANWLRGEPDDVNIMLPYDEVVEALGRQGERRIGLRVIKLDSIVGSVDRGRDFDRRFRPTSGRVRERWERLALASRRGENIPPIEVYRIGGLHFIADGHHRVSVAHAQGLSTIDAYVTEVRTKLDPGGIRYRGDLIVKDYRRLFLDRVPLTGQARASIVLSDAESYAALGEHVEAWGFRLMQDEGVFSDRATIAARWYSDEYEPVVRMLRQAELIGARTEGEAYLWVAGERYRLIRTHRWDDEVIAAVRARERRAPTDLDDSLEGPRGLA
ncbi:chromosome partitioning protein ParB [Amycolatopsis antarctica]|uniref:Chromosome partitioning protein ParB n=1 Tax=Amycolatopsis antarctica TaxID=1854586 RepID=A0A263D9N0_9PSEU|nr:chromosome partitioning protein ParB [Amycolatopsis antarctica]OZM75173.1 chromosome partitioning protein ParB [Amycolatopsis antarctica]